MYFRVALLAGVVSVALVGCQTPKKPEAPPPPEANVRFEPAWAVSPIHHDEGRYGDLFSGASRGVWNTSQVAAMKKAASEAPPPELTPPHLDEDAQALTEAYVVIECHLVSEFNDMSIAYDVARLRGIQTYLMTPDGTRIDPIQIRSFGPVEETPVDALKRFSLTTVVIFPRDNLLIGMPALSAEAPSVRLVLEGHDSKYYFEWAGMPPGETGLRAPTQEEAVYITKLGYYELYTGIRRLAHIFD